MAISSLLVAEISNEVSPVRLIVAEPNYSTPSVSATKSAVRVRLQGKFICSNAAVVVFGNSIELGLGLASGSLPWPQRLGELLRWRADLSGLVVVNEGVAGSAIVSTGVFGAPSLVQTIRTRMPVYRGHTFRRLWVILHPSIVELQSTNVVESDESVAYRALGGVVRSVGLLRRFGVTEILVVPTAPLTTGANDEWRKVGVDVNRRVELLNSYLEVAGISSPNMLRNPVLGSDGAGVESFFDGLVMPPDYPFPIKGSDGQHLDADGHDEVAFGVALLPETEKALSRICRRTR